MQGKTNQKGITLIAMVIAIIVIIILSAVTILITLNGGIFDRATAAAFETEKAQAREQIEIVLANAFTEKQVNEEYNENDFLDDFIEKESNGEIRTTEDTIEKDGFLFELDRSVPEIGEYIRKITDPIIDDIRVIEKTTNSVTIEVDARDDDEATYTYLIKKESDGDDAWVEVEKTDKNTCKFENLEDGIVYEIKVVIENFRGETEDTIYVRTDEMPTGAIIFSNPEWNEGEASVVISTQEKDFILQYQINDYKGEWIDIESGDIISGLEYADEVYARLWDGNNASEYAYVKVEDTVPPVVTVLPGDIFSDRITVDVNVVDKESGMIDNPTYTYYIKESSQGDESYVSPDGAQDISLDTFTFRNLKDGVSYDIRVEVKADKAGNMGHSSLTGQVTKEIPGGETGLIEGAISFGDIEWAEGKAGVSISTNTDYSIEYQINGFEEDKWTNIQNGGKVNKLNNNDIVYARLTDGGNAGDYASISIQDLTDPTVTVTTTETTSNSIAVRAQVEDKETGMKANPTFTYQIKKASEPDSNYSSPVGATDMKDNYYTFTGLEDGETYDIRVIVDGDLAGNIGTEYLKNRTTDTVPDGEIEGAISFENVVWSGGKASVTISTNTDYTIEYQVNSAAGEWITIANGGVISGLENPSTVYARLTDGVNAGEYAMLEVIDANPPSVTVTLTGTASNSLSVKAAATDAESGMDSNVTYTYSIKKTGDNNYTTPADGTTTLDTYTFTGLEDGTSYDIQVVVDGDAAGNAGTGYLSNQTTTKIPGGSAAVTSGEITFSSPIWSGGNASVTISTNTTYTIQYQVGNYTGTWTDIANGGRTPSVSNNTTIYARLTDGVNAGEYASVTITDTTPPNSFSISASNITATSFTINGTTTDDQTGINRYEYYVDGTYKGTNSNITGVSTGTHSVYVIAYDNAGNNRQSNTISVTTNVAPNTPSVSLYSKTTNSLQVQTRATDSNDGQTLTYTLYTSTNGSSWTRQGSTSATEGNYVYLTASGLSQYTYYYYYVNVSDGYASTDSSKTSRVRTYCPGNTYYHNTTYCSGRRYVSCSRCGGSGRIKCPGTVVASGTTTRSCSCGGTATGTRYYCSTCGMSGFGGGTCNKCGKYIAETYYNHSANAYITCTSCGGSGGSYYNCTHGYSSSHYYCSHYSNTSSTGHYYCEHGYTSQHD